MLRSRCLPPRPERKLCPAELGYDKPNHTSWVWSCGEKKGVARGKQRGEESSQVSWEQRILALD